MGWFKEFVSDLTGDSTSKVSEAGHDFRDQSGARSGEDRMAAFMALASLPGCTKAPQAVAAAPASTPTPEIKVVDYANGTNPNLVDTDGDGVPDAQDEYPLDPRRSHDVPIASLSVINMSGTTA